MLIDGKDIQEYDTAQLRQQIGYVMQEPVLFNKTIKENILFGKLDAPDSKVHQMAEAANALQFIQSNYEEMTPEEQLDEVRKDIREYATIKHKIPELNKLSKLADLDALSVVKFTLENGDTKFIEWLRDNEEFFIDIVANELVDKPL